MPMSTAARIALVCLIIGLALALLRWTVGTFELIEFQESTFWILQGSWLLDILLLHVPLIIFFGVFASGRGGQPGHGQPPQYMTDAFAPPVIGDDAPLQPRALGGWLILPTIGLVLSPLIIAGSIIFTLSVGLGPDGADIEDMFPGFGLAVAVDILLALALLVFEIFVMVQFFRKKKSVPALMITLLLCNVGIAIISAATTASVFGEVEPIGIRAIVQSIASCAIWAPYFSVSKRVKQTFILP